jgi:hypothetical protein
MILRTAMHVNAGHASGQGLQSTTEQAGRVDARRRNVFQGEGVCGSERSTAGGRTVRPVCDGTMVFWREWSVDKESSRRLLQC